MACCGDREKPAKSEIPNLSGELKIWNEDGSINTVSLNEREVWTLRAIVKESLKRAQNEHGWANGDAKATIIGLDQKINTETPKKGCGSGQCGCAH